MYINYLWDQSWDRIRTEHVRAYVNAFVFLAIQTLFDGNYVYETLRNPFDRIRLA